MEFTLVIKGYVDGTVAEALERAAEMGESCLQVGADCWDVLSVDGDLLWKSHDLAGRGEEQ